MNKYDIKANEMVKQTNEYDIKAKRAIKELRVGV